MNPFYLILAGIALFSFGVGYDHGIGAGCYTSAASLTLYGIVLLYLVERRNKQAQVVNNAAPSARELYDLYFKQQAGSHR